jgi:hypothetical protein
MTARVDSKRPARVIDGVRVTLLVQPPATGKYGDARSYDQRLIHFRCYDIARGRGCDVAVERKVAQDGSGAYKIGNYAAADEATLTWAEERAAAMARVAWRGR